MFRMHAAIALLALAAAGAQPPGQPTASYWFPEELLSWTPESDPDAAFNRSWVELSDRSWSDTQCNAHARQGEGGITAVSIMYPSTSGNPSQGSDTVDVYAFGYWQYLDLLVFWGGSAGEGLILAPSADVIDAAHRNGVPVYGTVFFPPTQYGGQIEWVWDLVQEEGGTYPVADKLVEVAEHYGFEGWFINQETAGGTAELAEAMRDMMLHVQQTSDVEIQWYDAMTEGGGIAWQNALNDNNDWFFSHQGDTVSQSMFLNFWWSAAGLESSADHAVNLGRSPYELYAGADVQANGYNTPVNWDGVFPEGAPHTTSLAFYCPNWTYTESSGLEDFYQRANRFWVGENRDPGNTYTSDDWKGLAHYVPARTPVTAAPFRTTFCTGQGYAYWVEGQQSGISGWNNRSLQDPQPTYRWIVECDGEPLYPELDHSAAWEGGSSLLLSGDLYAGSPSTVYLYKAEMELSGDESLRLVWDTGGSAGDPSMLRVGLGLSGSPDDLVYLDVGAATGEGWSEALLPLSSLAGETVSLIALEVASEETVTGFQGRIGELSVIEGAADVPAPPSSFSVDQFIQVDDDNGTLRLSWEHSPDPVRHYSVYQLDAQGDPAWLGATPGNALFVPNLTRPPGETEGTLLLEALGPEGGRSDTLTATVQWTVTGVQHPRSRTPLALDVPRPNPVAGEATIGFALPEPGRASIRIYSLSGRLEAVLLDGDMPAGPGSLTWAAGGLPAGVYHVVLQQDGARREARCVVL
jgi:mannosyl-glycoprotein endo-beta-N-acetylglucosaminidase